MSNVHYKGDYNSRTACGRTSRQKSQTTTHWMRVTCPRCLERHARATERSVNAPAWNPADDQVAGPHGAFKITRSEGVVKTTIGNLKRLIRENMGDFQPGQWYTWEDAKGTHTGQLSIEQMGNVQVAKLRHGAGISTQQRLDLWASQNPRPATPEEIETEQSRR